MYFKDYSEPYVELQEPNIEIVLKDMNTNEIEEKIIIWEGDFDDILSVIPLNEEGEYVALSYHQNIDFPWEKIEPDYWTMDYLDESLEQLLMDMMLKLMLVNRISIFQERMNIKTH